jgi:peptidylprolyl isomerase
MRTNRVATYLIIAAAITLVPLAPALCGEKKMTEEATNQIVTTPSGLRYKDAVVGTGAKAEAGKQVIVHYTGWLDDNGAQGKKFDSSKDRGEPFSFNLGARQVIAGWDEGVAGMMVGGKRTLMIPADLGYGARGAGGVIPPNAGLIFDVELLGVK